MKTVKLTLNFDDNLGLEGATIDYNDTGYKDSGMFLYMVAVGLVKGIEYNKDELMMYDDLADMGIGRPTE
jgi:hypothetical protein